MKKQQIVAGALVAFMSVAGFALATNMPETPINSNEPSTVQQKPNNPSRRPIILRPRIAATTGSTLTGGVASGGRLEAGVRNIKLPINTIKKKEDLTEIQAEKKLAERKEKSKDATQVKDEGIKQPVNNSVAQIVRTLLLKRLLEKKLLDKKNSTIDLYDDSSRIEIKK